MKPKLDNDGNIIPENQGVMVRPNDLVWHNQASIRNPEPGFVGSNQHWSRQSTGPVFEYSKKIEDDVFFRIETFFLKNDRHDFNPKEMLFIESMLEKRINDKQLTEKQLKYLFDLSNKLNLLGSMLGGSHRSIKNYGKFMKYGHLIPMVIM